MKTLIGVLAAVALLVCTSAAFLHLWGVVTMAQYKTILFIASLAYFVFATLWVTRPKSTH